MKNDVIFGSPCLQPQREFHKSSEPDQNVEAVLFVSHLLVYFKIVLQVLITSGRRTSEGIQQKCRPTWGAGDDADSSLQATR